MNRLTWKELRDYEHFHRLSLHITYEHEDDAEPVSEVVKRVTLMMASAVAFLSYYLIDKMTVAIGMLN